VADIVADDADALQSIAHKEVAGALLWRPAVAWQIEQRHAGGDVDMHELDEANSHWNLVALYGASGEAAAHDFETAIAALRTSGELARTLGRYADAATLDESRRTATRPAEPIGQMPMHAARQATCASAKSGKVPPALFTEAQANTGRQLFSDKCALCHGANLEGRVGPSLKGKMFLSKAAAHTVADIFRIISQNMPATMPGTLNHDEYVNIMAFLLLQNGYPSGASELTFDVALKSKTLMIYRGE
jgi:mono/diheme cytochrome c family protein